MKMLFEKYIEPLKGMQQNPEYHGEGDVYSHTMMVLDYLHDMPEYNFLTNEEKEIVDTACLFHDIGKSVCTRIEDGKIASREHSLKGSSMTRKILWEEGFCGNGMIFRESVCWLIAMHGKMPHFWERLEEDEQEAIRWIKRITLSNPSECSMKLLWILCMADWNGRICNRKDYGLVSLDALRQYAMDNDCFENPPIYADAYSRFAFLNGKTNTPLDALYDSTWGVVTIMSGLPGTGKTTWIVNNEADKPVISLDEIRRRKGILPSDEQGEVMQEAFDSAKSYLRKHQPFVWDATCLNHDARKKICGLCLDYGAFTRICYLETDDDTRSNRNTRRSHVVPDEVIDKMKIKLSPPDFTECHNTEWIVN